MAKRRAASQPPSSTIQSIDDLLPDRQNANAGTDRGALLIRESLELVGAGRSILADKHGRIIAGNKTLREAKAQGYDIDVVQTTGQELVVVQRTDLSLEDDRLARARQLAYYDNRTSEVDLKWSPSQIQADVFAGVDLTGSFFPEEVTALTKALTLPTSQTDAEPTPSPEPDAAEAAPIPPTEPAAVEASGEKSPAVPRSTYIIVFDNLEQHMTWSALMRRLREQYPEAKSPGARLAAHLHATGVAL